MDNTILGTANATKTFSAKYEPYDTTDTEFTVPDLTQGVTDDGESFSIPSSLIWSGQPETWTGKYQDNNNLTCTIVGYGDGDLGCVSSLANTLIYYAKAKGVKTDDISAAKTSYENKTTASAALLQSWHSSPCTWANSSSTESGTSIVMISVWAFPTIIPTCRDCGDQAGSAERFYAEW